MWPAKAYANEWSLTTKSPIIEAVPDGFRIIIVSKKTFTWNEIWFWCLDTCQCDLLKILKFDIIYAHFQYIINFVFRHMWQTGLILLSRSTVTQLTTTAQIHCYDKSHYYTYSKKKYYVRLENIPLIKVLFSSSNMSCYT